MPPRTVEEIMQRADEQAARFESYETNPADELDADAVALLRAAVVGRSQAERQQIEAVAGGAGCRLPPVGRGVLPRHQRRGRPPALRQ